MSAHDWPKSRDEYRRWKFDPRGRPFIGELYRQDFSHWLSIELSGLCPAVVAAEKIAVKVSECAQREHRLPSSVERWLVCIEVDEFPMSSVDGAASVRRLMHQCGVVALNTPQTLLRVKRYYSMSLLQYEVFEKMMEV